MFRFLYFYNIFIYFFIYIFLMEKSDPRGVTTDLWEGGGGRGRNNGKTLLTRGHIWNFRCLDISSLPPLILVISNHLPPEMYAQPYQPHQWPRLLPDSTDSCFKNMQLFVPSQISRLIKIWKLATGISSSNDPLLHECKLWAHLISEDAGCSQAHSTFHIAPD